jgi:hypothetical protein
MWLEVPDLQLGEGIHTVRMARPIQDPAPGTLALFVDTIILSGDHTYHPAEESEWVPFIELREDVAPYTVSGTFEVAGFPSGTYQCWVGLLDDGVLLDQSARAGAESNLLKIRLPTGE